MIAIVKLAINSRFFFICLSWNKKGTGQKLRKISKQNDKTHRSILSKALRGRTDALTKTKGKAALYINTEGHTKGS